MNITETVCAYDKPRLIAWNKAFGARRWLWTVREQHLEPLGESSCCYHTTDRLTGVLAPMVFLCFGGYMRRGFKHSQPGDSGSRAAGPPTAKRRSYTCLHLHLSARTWRL